MANEYDVPLNKAYQNHYYPQMAHLIRLFFGQALKTNKNLKFAVITGYLRIARKCIFTGLNNFMVHTITDITFAEYFGFTNNEVREILEYYGVGNRFTNVKEWHDGYHFGNANIYCPRDVLNQCYKFKTTENTMMEQIEKGKYEKALKQEGMRTNHKYGIACYKKSCKVIYKKE